MNLFRLIVGFVKHTLLILCMIIWMVVVALSAIFILPFCNYKDTLGAGSEWFAWHPVIVGDQNTLNFRDIRWFTTLRREFSDIWCGYSYEDIK